MSIASPNTAGCSASEGQTKPHWGTGQCRASAASWVSTTGIPWSFASDQWDIVGPFESAKVWHWQQRHASSKGWVKECPEPLLIDFIGGWARQVMSPRFELMAMREPSSKYVLGLAKCWSSWDSFKFWPSFFLLGRVRFWALHTLGFA